MVLAQKNGKIDQWNRIESPEISTCGQPVYDKGGKDIGEKTVSSISGAGKPGQQVKE